MNIYNSWENFILLALRFKFVIHFELIFVYEVNSITHMSYPELSNSIYQIDK